ncbi:odorant receptor 131-2-like [Dendropsophus ebraccatus]|uniref:odorant receptor 131-2-like n=1 Tax=Dendropsophus ebraccatus TaxID=150705 RepID=UPI003831B69E
MPNSSIFQSNGSQITSSKTVDNIKLGLTLLIIACFGFFLYFVALILSAFFTTFHIRENARYIFFIHMLINDTSYLVLGIKLLIMSIYHVPMPGPICYVLFTVCAAAFRTTSYNLATMAIERYVAICRPLHHGRLCSAQRAHWAIAFMWFLCFIHFVVDLSFILSSSIRLYSLNVLCSQVTTIVNPIQNITRSISHFIGFISVGLIIFYTYIKIVLVARKVSSQLPSASQAGRTVMLHAFQLLLCMTDLLANLPVSYQDNQFLPLVNFLLYSCVPRFLSPLIYGLRDEILRSYIKQTVKRHFIWKVLYQR